MKEAKKEANYMSERHPEEANHRLEQTKSPLCSSKRQHKEKKKLKWSLEKENPEDNPEKKKTQIDL